MYFKWNDISSETYGIIVLGLPTYLSPAERAEQVTVPGRSGFLTMMQGRDVFDQINLSCTCLINDISNIPSITAWLRGSNKKIEFSDRPTGYYKGKVANQLQYDKVVRGNPHRSFSVQFIAQPYFYLTSGDTEVSIPSTGYRFTNPGNVSSQPIIELRGTGDVTLTAGADLSDVQSTMLVDDLGDLSYIILDCEAKIAYGATLENPTVEVPLNHKVTGEWLTLGTGQPAFHYTLSTGAMLTTCKVKPKWRQI